MLSHKDGKIDESMLEKVLAKITEHHDALRMVYEIDGNRVVQVNRGVGGKVFDLDVFRLEEEVEREIEAGANRIQRSIDLENGPLLKAGLFKTPGNDHLLLVIHHLVVDGVSWRILLEDLSAGYRQAERGEEILFQDKTDSFRFWAQKLSEYVDTREALKELAYWKEIEMEEIKQLPGDHSIERERRKMKNNETLRFRLTEVETGHFLKEVHRVYNTEVNDILVTALGTAFQQWAGVERIAVNLEGHGREPLVEGVDVSRTVGWFTSHFPVVLDIKEVDPISYKIKKVKETLRRIPNRGAGYGILKYLTPEDKREGVPFNIEPGINFNYLGQFNDETGTNDAVFRFSPMNMGDIMSPESEEVYTFDISGMVVEDRLTLSISYNTYEYDKTTVESLLNLYRKNLLDIIEHCTAKEGKEITPSDVGDEELTLEELSEIEEMIHI
jgi:non-ribosomal peptide synthase protein (TIGR01720 family)